jgi:hypothetical protein
MAANNMSGAGQKLAVDSPYLSFADKIFNKYRDYYTEKTRGRSKAGILRSSA